MDAYGLRHGALRPQAFISNYDTNPHDSEWGARTVGEGCWKRERRFGAADSAREDLVLH